jgi:hypothetical protein
MDVGRSSPCHILTFKRLLQRVKKGVGPHLYLSSRNGYPNNGPHLDLVHLAKLGTDIQEGSGTLRPLLCSACHLRLYEKDVKGSGRDLL